MSIEKQIEESVHQTAEHIRFFVKSKLKFWQTLPYFFLLGNNNICVDEFEKEIYDHHLYNISYNSRSSVNYLTGDIYSFDLLCDDYTLVSDLTNFCHTNINLFDGERVIENLYFHAKMNKYSINAKWRKKYINKYKIEIPHTILMLL